MLNKVPRKFGLTSMILLGLNAVIGSGIFLLPGKPMELVGPASIFVYLFVTIVAATIALCFAECASYFNRNGAAYLYAKEAFGDFIGFEVGLLKWAVNIIALATFTVGFVTALSQIFPRILEEPVRTLLISAILAGLAFLNILGVHLVKYLNNVVTIGKLFPLLLFILIGIFFIDFDNFLPMFPNGINSEAVGSSALIVFFAFTGFEAIALAAEDMDQPRKNLPIAILVVLFGSAFIYFLVQTIVIGILGESLSQSVTPVADAANIILGNWGLWLVTAGTLISIGGINVAASFLGPRSGVALAQDRLIPSFIAAKCRFDTPLYAILITTLLAAGVAFSGSFVQLAAISVVARLAQFIPTSLAVLVLRKRYPQLPGAFRIPYGPAIPLFAFCFSLWLLSNASSMELFFGLSSFILGAPLFLIMQLKKESGVRSRESEC